MTKLSFKEKTIIVFGLILTTVFVTTIVHLHIEKTYWKERTADYNYSNWLNLGQMAQSIDNSGYTIDNLKEHSLRINGLIFSNTVPLMPALNGNGKAHSFMEGYYDSFVKDLTSSRLNDEQKEKGMLIFKAMNQEFISLCNDITDSTNQEKTDLVDNDSSFYKQTEEKIIAFCNKYAEQISQFTYNTRY